MMKFCDFYSISDTEELSLYDKFVCSTCKPAWWNDAYGEVPGGVGGWCCKEKPCEVSPRQLGEVTSETIKKFLKANDWALIEVIGRGYYRIRARGDWDERVMKHGCPVVSYYTDDFSGGRCVLLDNDGCALSESERPDGGRLLVPELRNDKTVGCKPFRHISWKPYQDILSKTTDEILMEYSDEEPVAG
jgi:hypothetical protein